MYPKIVNIDGSLNHFHNVSARISIHQEFGGDRILGSNPGHGRLMLNSDKSFIYNVGAYYRPQSIVKQGDIRYNIQLMYLVASAHLYV